MVVEVGTIILSMIINLSVSIIKISAGVVCSSKSMLADGFYSLSGFISDIVAYIGTKCSRKRANQTHPDGYGRVEYIVNIFIAALIFMIGTFTIINSFNGEEVTSHPLWVSAIIITIIFKLILSKILNKIGMEKHSTILVTSGIEAHDDVTSSLGVVIIITLSAFKDYFPLLEYIDSIGSIIIGLLIFKTSIELFKENISQLVGVNEKNKEVENKIKEIIKVYDEIEYKNIELERHGNYYVLELDVYVLKNIKVYKLLSIENEIKNKIKKLSCRIKFVDINLVEKSSKNN